MDKNGTTKVIMTLTTIPTRLKFQDDQGFKLCLASLLDQSYEDYEIHFNIPHVLKTTGEPYIIPDYVMNHPDERLKIYRTDDLGCATKLLPTVERISDPNTIIIVVDDDLVYHCDLIKEQLVNREKWPECVVGYDGLRSKEHFFGDQRDFYFTSNYRDSRVDILQHYKSVSYERRFFEDDFPQFVIDNFSWSDDLMIAGYFAYKKRDRIATFHPGDSQFKTLDEWIASGGVITFPVLRHTHHERDEGCNVFREKKIDDNGGKLYKFIDNGY